MKTVKTIITAFMLLTFMANYANDGKVISSTNEEVTITEENELVQVSILNTNNTNYTLAVYSEDGELLYKEELGNASSLGKTFDFNSSVVGTYKFKLIDSEGKVSSYKVKTGSRS